MKKEIAKEIFELVQKLNLKIIEAKQIGLITDIYVSNLEPHTGVHVKLLEEVTLE